MLLNDVAGEVQSVTGFKNKFGFYHPNDDENIDGVLNATIIEKDDAVRIFKDQFGEDIIELLGYNPLPAMRTLSPW